MILDLFYITLIIFAIISIQTTVLRNAIIYLSVFSLLCSVVYLLLGAPDVAIAEAAIGCTLSTILFLVALKKYRIFTVYYNCTVDSIDDLPTLKLEKEDIRQQLVKFSNSSELQLDMINTSSGLKHLSKSVSFDIIIFHSTHGIWLHGFKNSYQYNQLVEQFQENLTIPVFAYFLEEEDTDDIFSE